MKCRKSSKRSRFFIESVNGKAFLPWWDPSDAHLFGQISRKAGKSRLWHQQQAASSDPLWSTSSPANLSVGAASINFSFASQVAEDQTSNAMEDVSCLRPQAESRVPPAPTRRSTILDLVSQSGDHQTGSCRTRSGKHHYIGRGSAIKLKLYSFFLLNLINCYHGNLSSSFFWV